MKTKIPGLSKIIDLQNILQLHYNFTVFYWYNKSGNESYIIAAIMVIEDEPAISELSLLGGIIMRIGEVNLNNYQEFLKMFGGKSNKALDNLIGKDETTEDIMTIEEVQERLIKAGYVEEGMYIGGSDTSWKKIVPVSDDMKTKYRIS